MAKIKFILNRPRNPINIGAAARGMANYGFRELVVVEPYAPIWREVRSAVGAHDVVKKAKKMMSLKKALGFAHVVIGTSAGSRRGPGGKWIGPEEARALVEGARKKRRSVAVVFGSEKSGLSNEDLDHCHYILKLPTAVDTPSMNLAQAVAVVAYILRHDRTSPPPPPQFAGQVRAEEVERLIAQANIAFKKTGILNAWDKERSEGRIRRAFFAWNLTPVDMAILHNLFRWVIQRAAKS